MIKCFGCTATDCTITTTIVIIYVILNIVNDDSSCKCVRGAVVIGNSILKLQFIFLLYNQAFEKIFKVVTKSICIYLSRISSIFIFWSKFTESKCNISHSLWFDTNYSCAFAKLLIPQTETQLSTCVSGGETHATPVATKTIQVTVATLIEVIEAIDGLYEAICVGGKLVCFALF